MIWRLWSAISGVPVGVLVALAALHAPGPGPLLWAALAGGAGLLGLVWLLARRRDDEPERTRHLAAGVAWAWLALPACVAVVLGFAPGPWPLLAIVVLGLAAGLYAGARAIGQARGPLGWGLRSAAVARGGGAALVGLAALLAALGAERLEVSERWSHAVYDTDASVATVELPACAPEAAAVEVLLPRGAHPVLDADGSALWFDAVADQGRRQIHRIGLADRAVECWTCGEAGQNVRPFAGDTGGGVVFETDRHATWLHPDDTEIHLIAARRGKRHPVSRRLTFDPGPDDHALLGPGARTLVWSKRRGGRFDVVAASIRTGHGGLLLGRANLVASGGAAWIAPLGWSPDARTLVVATGNPFAPLKAHAIDPATGIPTPIRADSGRRAAFNADGGWIALAAGRPDHPGSVLPGFLGFALAPLATAASRERAVLGSTELHAGPAPGPGTLVELPEAVTTWGGSTGVALAADGTTLFVGQRRRAGDGVQERLLEVRLRCDTTAFAALR
ncbi:MAG: hypothetical protein QNK03_17965 [Myxococcota bacterium]|nr:hypothetical protein [Myxococcota bacterium]